MKQDEGKRRSFLKHVLAGSAAVAGVALTRKSVQAKSATKDIATSKDLYRESADFTKYYDSLRK